MSASLPGHRSGVGCDERSSVEVIPGKPALTLLIWSTAMEPGQSRGGGTEPPPPGDAWTALSYLLSGFFLFGGIGWGLDALLGTRVFTPVGLLFGGAASMYLIYIRYVKS
jgi:hypothetical protein